MFVSIEQPVVPKLSYSQEFAVKKKIQNNE